MSYQIFFYKKIILYSRKGLTQVATNIRVDFHRSNMRENRHPLPTSRNRYFSSHPILGSWSPVFNPLSAFYAHVRR